MGRVQNRVAGAWVAIARLAHAAHVDDRLLALREAIAVLSEFIGWVEVGFVGEDSGDVGVTDDADAFDAIKEAAEFFWCVGCVFREDVLVDGLAR